MKNIIDFLLSKISKTRFLSLRFNDVDPLHDLGRLMQDLLTKGKEIGSESIWLSSKDRKALGTYMYLENMCEFRR
jgi:hypothetical protein